MSKAHSLDAMQKVVELLDANSTILDVGCGINQPAATFFRKAEHIVETNDFVGDVTFLGDYNKININKQYDCVWSAHCLEHQLNVHNYLIKLKNNTKENGILAITVPPHKQTIVSGHVTIWNIGLLLYNLVYAGIDCCDAICKKYGYNISIIIRKKSFELPDDITHNAGDLIRLKERFPKGLNMSLKDCSFNGDIENINWV